VELSLINNTTELVNGVPIPHGQCRKRVRKKPRLAQAEANHDDYGDAQSTSLAALCSEHALELQHRDRTIELQVEKIARLEDIIAACISAIPIYGYVPDHLERMIRRDAGGVYRQGSHSADDRPGTQDAQRSSGTEDSSAEANRDGRGPAMNSTGSQKVSSAKVVAFDQLSDFSTLFTELEEPGEDPWRAVQ
jgi:hypothetical protein